MQPTQWRYFLGFIPDDRLRDRILMLAEAMGIAAGAVIGNIHLTICTIAETDQQDGMIADRLDGLFSGADLAACRILLGKARSSSRGAAIGSVGSQHDITIFFQTLRKLLAELGIEPLYRKSGLHAHVTLSYQSGPSRLLKVPFEWVPAELCLVESWDGFSKHVVLRRWPLLPPAQGELDWGEPAGNFTNRLRQESLRAA